MNDKISEEISHGFQGTIPVFTKDTKENHEMLMLG